MIKYIEELALDPQLQALVQRKQLHNVEVTPKEIRAAQSVATQIDGQNGIGRVTFAELVANYRQKSFSKLRTTTQSTTAHILHHYLLPRWGDSFALEINLDDIEEWLGALVLANPTREKIRRVMNVV